MTLTAEALLTAEEFLARDDLDGPVELLNGRLRFEDVLPGFSVPVQQLFN